MINREPNSQKKNRKKTPGSEFGGKPDLFLIICIQIFIWFWFLRFHPKYDKSCLRGCKRPYILIANHPSSLDAFLIARGLGPRNTNYVASQYFFRSPVLRFLLGRAGAIPKSHSQKDIQSVRLMMKTLAAGRVLMLCPEGRRSLDGTGSHFSEAMAKFVKKTGFPVVAALITGTYLAWPRWADKVRPGPLSITFQKVFDSDELISLTIPEIHQQMLEALRFNEYEANRKARHRYRSRHSAEKIERLLHLCPCCGHWEAIEGRGVAITCLFCGAAAVMEPTGAIRHLSGSMETWPDVPSWYALQRSRMTEAMRDPAFRLDAEVSCLSRAQGHEKPMVPLGSGNVRLDREGLFFSGNVAGSSFSRSFAINLMDTLPVSLGYYFEICDEVGTYWQFQLKDERKEVQFEQFADIFLHGENAAGK